MSKSLALSVSLGDTYQVRKTLSSFVDGRVVWGVWVYDVNSKEIIGGKNQQLSSTVLGPENDNPIQLVEGSLLAVSHRMLTISNGRVVASAVSSTRIDSIVVLQLTLSIAAIFILSTWFFTNQFHSIGRAVADPISQFTKRLNSADSLEEKFSKPLNSLYLEIEELYEKYGEFVDKSLMAKIVEREAAIGRITANLSHDLRAPLGTFERLLNEPHMNSLIVRNSIRDSLNRLYSMIDSLRYSEVENLVKRGRCHMNFLFARESLEESARRRDIAVSVPMSDIGELWIDGMKVERAWINLASNAVESARSFVRVDVEKVDTSLYIRVIDDGAGFPKEILPKMFQRGTTFGKPGGTGLGLSYAKQIMQGHGGDVNYRRENDLTIFECHIPEAFHPATSNRVLRSGIEIASTRPSKSVSICFEPHELGIKIQRRLNEFRQDTYHFSPTYDESSGIIFTNVDELSMRGLYQGMEVVQISKKHSAEELISRIVSRLNIG